MLVPVCLGQVIIIDHPETTGIGMTGGQIIICGDCGSVPQGVVHEVPKICPRRPRFDVVIGD